MRRRERSKREGERDEIVEERDCENYLCIFSINSPLDIDTASNEEVSLN